MKKIVLMAIAILICVSVLPVRAAEPLPFGPGERLKYEIYWTVFHAGGAVLEVMPDTEMNGVPARYFKATAKTVSWVDKFYKVRDVLEAWTNMDVTHSLRYKKDQNEGTYHKKVDLTFDKDKNVSFRYARGRLTRVIEQPEDVFDPMSILFNFRTIPLEKGLHFKANVSDGKKTVVGEAFVEGIETVETDLGKFKTYRVRLDVKHLSGVFKKSDDAELYVWFTADERRLPLKVRSKVVVGHFNMYLVGYAPPTQTVAQSQP